MLCLRDREKITHENKSLFCVVFGFLLLLLLLQDKKESNL